MTDTLSDRRVGFGEDRAYALLLSESSQPLDLECPICLDTLADDTVFLPCTHSMHRECLTQHFLPECPVCRRPQTLVPVTGSLPSRSPFEEDAGADTEEENLFDHRWRTTTSCNDIFTVLLVAWGFFFVLSRVHLERHETRYNGLMCMGLPILVLLIFRFLALVQVGLYTKPPPQTVQ